MTSEIAAGLFSANFFLAVEDGMKGERRRRCVLSAGNVGDSVLRSRGDPSGINRVGWVWDDFSLGLGRSV